MVMHKTAFPTALPIVYSRHTGLLAIPQNLHPHLSGVKYFLSGIYMSSQLHLTLLKCHLLKEVVFDHSMSVVSVFPSRT